MEISRLTSFALEFFPKLFKIQRIEERHFRIFLENLRQIIYFLRELFETRYRGTFIFKFSWKARDKYKISYLFSKTFRNFGNLSLFISPIFLKILEDIRKRQV